MGEGPSAASRAGEKVAKDLHLEDISPEERELLPPLSKAERRRYLQIRNSLLYLWRKDVRKNLSLARAVEQAGKSAEDKEFAKLAWRYLDARGLINFGLAEDILKRRASSKTSHDKQKGTVVVLGAGLAGLAAAQQLLKFGYKAFVLEARGFPGGRVQAARLEGEGLTGVADLGGSVITGVDGNPLAVLASQLDIPMYKIQAEPEDCPVYQSDGNRVSSTTDQQALDVYFEAEDAALELQDMYSPAAVDAISYGTYMKLQISKHAENKELSNMMHWLYANVEFSAAALATDLSVSRWADDDQYGFTGDHVWLAGGTAQLVKALTKGVPILYNSPASRVHYGTDGVTVVTTQGRAVTADACIVTVPLGVLKANKINFFPPLPKAKMKAIKRLGFGVLNKVAMLFEEQWWGPNDTFGHVADAHDDESPGWCYLWYTYPDGIAGGPLLTALVAGQAAVHLESMGDEDVLQRVMQGLRTYHPDTDIPNPVSYTITRWGCDPWIRGSYSSVPPGSAGAADYQELARNVEGRIFFAGEATSAWYPAQMHGAFDSGLREAAKVHAAMLHREEHGKKGASMNALKKTVLPMLERSVRVFDLAKSVLTQCPDLRFDGWAALCATDPGSVAQWALVLVDTSKVRGQRVSTPSSIHLVHLQVVLDLAELGNDLEAVVHQLVTGPHAIRLHDRHMLTNEELDLMEEILGPRASSVRPRPCILADTLQKRAAGKG